MTNWSNKKLNRLRYLSYWLYMLIAIGTPIALVTWKFDIFAKPGPVQCTGWAIILGLILCVILSKLFKRVLADLEQGIIKTILHDGIMISPFFIAWGILTFLERYILQVRFIVFWTIIGLIVASFMDLFHTLILKEIKKRTK